MTDPQEKLYWRLWNRVCHVNDWRFLKGRILPEAQRDTSKHHVAVWQYAETRARGNHRSVTADDLRHGCHIHAIGRDKGHMDLEPRRECSRVFTLFKMLIEPTDLDAQMDWSDPERDERRVLVFAIKKYPFAAVDNIARDKFGGTYQSPFFDDLEIGQLRQLRVTLEGWTRRQHRKIEQPF